MNEGKRIEPPTKYRKQCDHWHHVRGCEMKMGLPGFTEEEIQTCDLKHGECEEFQ